jgi:hypothetical protein
MVVPCPLDATEEDFLCDECRTAKIERDDDHCHRHMMNVIIEKRLQKLKDKMGKDLAHWN